MSKLNLNREWKFIEFGKKVLDRKSLEFELLTIVQTLLVNYETAKTEKMKKFYKTLYLKSKNFLCRTKKVKI